jgi:hypothetical protein
MRSTDDRMTRAALFAVCKERRVRDRTGRGYVLTLLAARIGLPTPEVRGSALVRSEQQLASKPAKHSLRLVATPEWDFGCSKSSRSSSWSMIFRDRL